MSSGSGSASHLSSFIGRSEMLDLLKNAFEKTLMKHTQVMIISGEPGIGKTALVDEFLLEVVDEVPTVIVLRGRGYDIGQQGDAYGVLLQILESIPDPSRKRTPDSIKYRRFVANVLPAWLGVVPVFGQIAAAGTTTLASLLDLKNSEIENQTHVYQKAVQRISSIAKRNPLIIAVDDLQWADGSSLSAINYMVRELKEQGVLFLGTYRSEPPLTPESVLTQVLIELETAHLCIHKELTSLTFDETRRLLYQVMPNNLPIDFQQLLFRRSGGNPLYVRELALLMQMRGLVRQGRDGIWRQVSAANLNDIPTSLEDVLKQRVDLLSHELREICELAAVEGVKFALAVVTAIVESEQKLSRARVLQRLSDIENRFRLITTAGRQASMDFYRFVHGLIQEVLYRSLSEPLRRHYHLLIADRLRTLSDASDDTLAYELARQYQEGGDLEQAGPFWVRAGYNQLAAYGVSEAAQSFTNALVCIDPTIEKYADTPRKDDLLILKGRALMGQAEAYGVQALTPAALVAAQQAYEIWQTLHNDEEAAKALHRAGLCQHAHQNYAQALSNFQEGLRLAEQSRDEILQGKLLRDIGNTYIRTSAFEQALEYLERSVSLFSRTDNPKEWLVSMFVFGYCHYAQGDTTAALEAYRKSLEAAEAVKDDYRINQILQIQALALMRSGQLDAALDAARRAVQLSEQYHIEEFVATRRLGNLLYQARKFDEAGKVYTQCLIHSFDIHERNRFAFSASLAHMIGELLNVDLMRCKAWCIAFCEASELREREGKIAQGFRQLSDALQIQDHAIRHKQVMRECSVLEREWGPSLPYE